MCLSVPPPVHFGTDHPDARRGGVVPTRSTEAASKCCPRGAMHDDVVRERDGARLR
eukprot:CAMPEP_0119274696 /NCGR_PEP_ID=MMETSP1329-20130426/12637_1 /TAXON_ID=114041 /ORGANISM="Genus nov. species nov., Strain RCC1024" /LENGTH=55 /DNA_ID=CAMNT_0007275039 /DNA_START=136 /DNA_END=300 /DNA_ORIENTATION=+